jgi:hypothetical protein
VKVLAAGGGIAGFVAAIALLKLKREDIAGVWLE